MFCRLMIVLLVLSCAGRRVLARDLYVSPGGSDAGDGSAVKPFKTIAKARNCISSWGAGLIEDVHVWLNDGVYEQPATLVFDQHDGGRDGHSVFYQAMPGAHPEISGGVEITGWVLHDREKNIWEAAAVGIDTRQLYVNGKRAVRARSKLHPLAGGTVASTGFSVPGIHPISSWGNPDSIEFVHNSRLGGIAGGAGWLEPRIDVASVQVVDGTTVIMMKQPGFSMAFNDHSGQRKLGLPSYIENAYELLDQPGDWYLDKKAGKIYYIPRPGEKMATARVIAPLLQTVVFCGGTLEKPMQQLEFDGITFEHGTWLLPDTNTGFPELQANYLSDYKSYAPGEVLVRHASGVRFERCTFTHLGSAGLELSSGVQGSTVVGCRFTDISGCGIVQGDAHDYNRTEVRLREDHNTIEDSYFEDIGNEYHGACAIFCGYVSHTLIAHNEIIHCPYSGISVGWGWGKKSYASDNRVMNNLVRGWGESLSDCGALYSLSSEPNSEAAGNYFIASHVDCGGGAFYPDEGSAGWNIHDNVVDTPYPWIFIWAPSIRDLQVHDNWINTSKQTNKGTNITMADNTQVTGEWPAAAKEVMTQSGLEPQWVDIRTGSPGTPRAK